MIEPTREVDAQASPGVDSTRIPPAARLANSPTVVDFEELAHGAKELLIAYQGTHYRLRLTRNHKLILTK